ncbi:hypothetical protein [Desulfoscipio geothermicus]|jgi:hypothetical protein|uniref:Uncharacterized protein n=1 Tax=Desulfoscipio geothermicus DSM 3669 TaxID=1121426 RepID=A0A1I6CZS8_9FIRM|nr:hypothetical protein [Desulfoscipio geothermicus]SFQ98602.1 hypothetical protein SAMN05660706_103133 [Desulfoscipio geothermicus DSM 3669]
MSLVNNFQSLGEDLIRACEDRKKNISELRDYVNELLEQIASNRAAVSREMWEKLKEARLNRLDEVEKLLNEIIQDRSEARKIWAQTLDTLKKMGCS